MKPNKITALQYSTITFFLLNSFIMNVGYNKLTTTSYNDSILDILFGGFLIIIFSILIFNFQHKKRDHIINTIHKQFPKPLKLIIFLILFLIIGFSSTYSLTILANFISYYILKEVSLLIITITLIITILYIVSKGLATIGKISEIFFYIYIFIFIISTIGLIKYIDFSNLKPLFTTNLKNHFNTTSTYFLSSIIPLFLITMIPTKQVEFEETNKKIPYIFIIISIIIAFTQLIFIISVLGIHLANTYQIPDMIIYKKISFLNVLERIETILSLNNILNSLFIIIMGVYFMKELANHFLPNKKEHIILALLGIIIIILGNILPINTSIYLIISFILLIGILSLITIHLLGKNIH